MVDGRVILQTSEDWTPRRAARRSPPARSSRSRLTICVDGGALAPTVIFQPGPRQSIDGSATTKDKLIVVISDNVRGPRGGVYACG